MSYSNFDFKESNPKGYEELIASLKEIEKLCKTNKIPFFVTVITKAEDGNPTYETIAKSSFPQGYELRNDLIRKHLLVQKGFDVLPTDVLPDIEFN